MSAEIRNCVMVPQRWRRVPVRTFDRWLEDRPRDICPARPPRITEKGFRKGHVPTNKGKVWEYTPPTDDEIRRLLEACDPKRLTGRRNRALIALLRGCGLRIHEALLLIESDLDFEAGTVLVRRGKGGKRRKVGLMADARPELIDWIDTRQTAGFTEDEFLFCTVEGMTKGGHLYQAYFRTALHDLCDKAGIEKRITPHGLRHALALDMDRRHIPLSIIARQLGHSNVSTTATYLRGLSDDEVFDTLAGMQLAMEPTPGSQVERPAIWLPSGATA